MQNSNCTIDDVTTQLSVNDVWNIRQVQSILSGAYCRFLIVLRLPDNFTSFPSSGAVGTKMRCCASNVQCTAKIYDCNGNLDATKTDTGDAVFDLIFGSADLDGSYTAGKSFYLEMRFDFPAGGLVGQYVRAWMKCNCG